MGDVHRGQRHPVVEKPRETGIASLTETGTDEDASKHVLPEVFAACRVRSLAYRGQSCTAPSAKATDGFTGANGTWTFAPTDPNGTIDVADEDGYLQFGWWLNMKGNDVNDGFDVQTFASAPGMAKVQRRSCKVHCRRVARPTQVGPPASGQLPAPPKTPLKAGTSPPRRPSGWISMPTLPPKMPTSNKLA